MALRRKDIMLKATFNLVSWPVCHAGQLSLCDFYKNAVVREMSMSLDQKFVTCRCLSSVHIFIISILFPSSLIYSSFCLFCWQT